MMITLFSNIQLSKYLKKINSWMRDTVTQVEKVVLNFGENIFVKEYTDTCKSHGIWGCASVSVFPLMLMKCKQGLWCLAVQWSTWRGSMGSGLLISPKALLTPHLDHRFFSLRFMRFKLNFNHEVPTGTPLFC